LLKIQKDREQILRLLVTLPKSYIYDLVYNVYVPADLEENSSGRLNQGETDLNSASQVDVYDDQEDDEEDDEEEDDSEEDDDEVSDDVEEQLQKKKVEEEIQEITVIIFFLSTSRLSPIEARRYL
jgi:hypothetical protein